MLDVEVLLCCTNMAFRRLGVRVLDEAESDGTFTCEPGDMGGS